MERWRSRLPLLISILVVCVTVFSLTTYKAPTFAVPEDAAAASSPAAKPKLMEKASVSEAVKKAATPKGSKSVGKVSESGNYTDGVYYGSATGFKSTIKVKVVIKDGKIASIDVVSHGDDAAYFNRAKALLGRIVLKQTTNVDTVSGATYSSTGLIKAVRNALAKAEKKDKKSQNKKKTKKKKTEPAAGKAGQFPYPDGTYEGTAEGFCSDITVAVTLKNKTITSITVVSQDEDEEFFSRALAVLKSIVKAQSTKVDVVSGATYSSNGLINATINALKVAKAKADQQKAATQPSGTADPTKPSGTTDPTGTTDPSDPTGTDPTESSDPTDPSGSDPAEPTSETDPTEPAEPTEPTYPYADGTYSIDVRVYADEDEDFDDYDMTVEITISEGKISGVTVASSNSSPSDKAYIKRAQNGMKSKLVGRDSASGVDTVSGATCTSEAILDACRQALSQAKQ
ncbi:MAG: FMN-binding protein [Firmicutes bacterium]|nr:FMN-binding protein [Bacillota bacterium]